MSARYPLLGRPEGPRTPWRASLWPVGADVEVRHGARTLRVHVDVDAGACSGTGWACAELDAQGLRCRRYDAQLDVSPDCGRLAQCWLDEHGGER